MKKVYKDKFSSNWTRDDWRVYLKDMIEDSYHLAFRESFLGEFYRGKAQAYKDIFANMFPDEDWAD